MDERFLVQIDANSVAIANQIALDCFDSPRRGFEGSRFKRDPPTPNSADNSLSHWAMRGDEHR
jgi:hypothetical protein